MSGESADRSRHRRVLQPAPGISRGETQSTRRGSFHAEMPALSWRRSSTNSGGTPQRSTSSKPKRSEHKTTKSSDSSRSDLSHASLSSGDSTASNCFGVIGGDPDPESGEEEDSESDEEEDSSWIPFEEVVVEDNAVPLE